MCGGVPLPNPQGASNLQPVLHHAGVVSAHKWSTGEKNDHQRLCGADANALVEKLEPLWRIGCLKIDHRGERGIVGLEDMCYETRRAEA